MNIKLELPKLTDLRPRITVIGVGGAGGNAINNMIASGLEGVDFVVANTDAQALATSSAEHRIQLGVNLTEGLGAGSRPEIGQAAAEEALDDIRSQISGSHMVFVAGGMGGGTGSGAAGVIARTAKELGILTVGIVTKPFQFEGARRTRVAEAGIAELARYVDTLIVIPNQNLFRIANEKTTFADAFVLADQVLYSGIACIVDLIVKDGLINLDFADVQTVMGGMGTAMMGTGEASGERRATRAAEEAICNPLLDDVSLKGARGLLLSIIGGRDMTLYEVDEAATRVRQEVDPEANIIVGATFDESLGDRVRVSIVASGMARLNDRPGAPAPMVAAQRSTAFEVIRRPAPPPIPAVNPLKADSFTRMLSKAFEVPSGAPPAPNHHAGERKEEVWRAPGDVTIRTGLPNLAIGGLPTSPSQLTAGSERDDHPTDSQSVTRAGEDTSSMQQRQMPGINDFPPIGQREYRANSEFGADHKGSPRVYHEPVRPNAVRKPGLFERLTGMSRRQNESKQQFSVNYPQHYSQTVSAQPEASNIAPQHGLGVEANRGSPKNAQRHDIPIFFDQKRK